MAIAKSNRRRWLIPAGLLVVAAGFAAAWFSPYGAMLRGNATAGTAYLAHVACSCRYIAGRSLKDCEKDKMAGMELIGLDDDPDTRTVTASVPFLASDSATYREGYGCVLQDWRKSQGG